MVFPKRPATTVNAPPPYSSIDVAEPPQGSYSALADPSDRFDHARFEKSTNSGPSKWNALYWRKRTWAGLIAALVLVIVVVVVAVVEVEKEDKYPDYTTLSYSLTDTYSGTDFFDNFDYFVGYDPSSGFVHYSNPTQSVEMNLTYASSTSAILRVDNTDTNATTGRHSARLTSKNQYDTGLFIFDIAHAPYGCATWPSVWTSDPSNWPTNGEIDILEAVNQGVSGNQMTLHTTEGCTMKSVKRKETGTVVTENCLNSTDSNAGCGVKGPVDTYGPAFNTNGGGVYAMELRDAGIRIWFFNRASIPSDITNGTSPNPESWGEALADFPSTDCDISSHFTNQSIIADIDVCGDWAGATSVYTTEDQCPGTSCSAFAAVNATAFDEAYWEFKSFRVYTAA